VSSSQLTLSASLAAGSYLYRYEQDINQQIATIRIQKLNGGIEENLTISAKTYEYEIRVGAGGSDPSDTGSYHPLTFYNGSTGPFAPKAMAQIADGYVSLGGRYGSEALRAIYQSGAVNAFEISGGPTGYAPSIRGRGADTNVSVSLDMQGAGSFDVTAHSYGEYIARFFTAGSGAANRIDVYNGMTGFAPSIRGRGTDTNVGLSFDAQATGAIVFSNNGFATALLTLNGAAGTDSYIEINSGTASAAIAAKGATNADLVFTPNGTGVMRFGSYTGTALSPAGYITIKDSAGNTRRLLVG